MSYFKEKVCWVTGASSGIGEGVVKQLASQGAIVVLSARRKNELERVQKQAGLTHKNSLILEMDLSKPETFGQCYTEIIKVYKKVDILFNNGGISQRSLVKDTDLSTYKKIFDVNFFGNIALTKVVLQDMIDNKNGSIVVISSIVGKVATQLRSGYSASKHALQGFYDSLRLEVAHDNIQILTVLPGFINTNVSLNALTGNGEKYNKMDGALSEGMSVEECSYRILEAIENRQNEVIIAGIKENFAVILKRVAPDMLDMILRNTKVT
jgi:dehydrogenase/reductase SDR family protein 7B